MYILEPGGLPRTRLLQSRMLHGEAVVNRERLNGVPWGHKPGTSWEGSWGPDLVHRCPYVCFLQSGPFALVRNHLQTILSNCHILGWWFVNLDTVNILGWLIVCWGAVLCIVACLTVSLASTHRYPPPGVTTKRTSPDTARCLSLGCNTAIARLAVCLSHLLWKGCSF